jgi:hypothetical protein
MSDKTPQEQVDELVEQVAKVMDINCGLCNVTGIDDCGYKGELNLCKRRMEKARQLLSLNPNLAITTKCPECEERGYNCIAGMPIELAPILKELMEEMK